MDSMLGDLYNEMMCLCEIRGECGDDGNARIEERLAALQLQIEKLEKAGN